MTKLEKRRFLALAKKFDREADKFQRKARKLFRIAERSEDSVSNSERWAYVYSLDGAANANLRSAIEIRILTDKLSKPIKRK